MQINLTWDPSVDTIGADEAAFKAAVTFVANELGALITNPVTITINVGWGEITDSGGTTVIGPGSSLGGGVGSLYTYAELRNALQAHETTPQQVAAYSALPVADPSGGQGFVVPLEEALALGLNPHGQVAATGSIGFGAPLPGTSYNYSTTNRAIANETDFVGVVEHEMAHALGRVSYLGNGVMSPLDLFRFTAPGVLATSPTQTSYFSVDNGVTALKYFDATNNDAIDWAGDGPHASSNDAFDLISTVGTSSPLSSVDDMVMNLLGYTVSAPAGPAVTSVTETPASGVLHFGSVVSFTLNFSAAVTVSGNPFLTLNDGGKAVFAGGSGTTALTFTDTVAALDSAVASLAASAISLNGGTIRDSGAHDASLSLSGLAQAGPQVANVTQTLVFRTLGTSPSFGEGPNQGWPFDSPIKTAPGYKLIDVAIDDANQAPGNVILNPTGVSAYLFPNNPLTVTQAVLDSSLLSHTAINAADPVTDSALTLAALEQAYGAQIKANSPSRVIVDFSGHGSPVVFFQGALSISDSVKLMTYVKAVAQGAAVVLDTSTNCNNGYYDFLKNYVNCVDYIAASEQEVGGFAVDNSTVNQWLAVRNSTVLDSVWSSSRSTTQALQVMAQNMTALWNLEAAGLQAAGINGQQSFAAYDMHQFQALITALGALPGTEFSKMGYPDDVAQYIETSGNQTLIAALNAFMIDYVDTRGIATWSDSTAGIGVDLTGGLQIQALASAGHLTNGPTAATAIASNFAGALVIDDTGLNVASHLDALEATYEANQSNQVPGIVLSDASAPTLHISEAQLINDSYALSHVFAAYGIAVSGVAAADARGVSTIGHVTSVAVSDTAANVAANLDGLETLALAGRLASVSLTNGGTPTLTISDLQQHNDTAALALISGSYTLRAFAAAGPAITAVAETPSSGTVGAGGGVSLTLTFNEAVAVTGTPTLTLNDGGTATYQSGSGTTSLTFGYVVAPSDANIASLAISSVNLPGGATIRDAIAAIAAPLSLAGVSQTGPAINTNTPGVVSLIETPSSGALNLGKSVTLTVGFSEAVNVTGTPTLTLNDGGVATYAGGSGSTALTFAYTVGAGDADVAALAATTLNLAGGAIKNVGGNPANLSLSGISQAGPLIDKTPPAIASVLESPATGALNAGKAVTLTLGFSEAVTVTGTPTLTLNDGGTATYQSGSGSTALAFGYTVGASDTNTPSLAVSSVNLAGGAIKDAASNAAALSLSGVTQTGPAIDTTIPHVSAIAESPATGMIYAGQTETLTLSLSEAVTVTGTPTLTLNDGGTATYQSGSGSNALTFSYAVGLHDTSVATLSATTLNLSGGTIKDAGGNAASLSLSGLTQAGPQVLSVSDVLTNAFTNVLIASPTSTLATTPTIGTPSGPITNPIFTFAQSLPGLISSVTSGATSLSSALNTIEHWGDASTTVATIAYQFFTGGIPSQAGYGFLVNGTTNPNDLDSPYYAQFNIQNRYINFAANLGKFGAGQTFFQANYGSLSLQDAMTKAYTEIFGFAPAPGKIAGILASSAGAVGTIADYFAFYGTDGVNGIGTKAAAVGWLMTVAVQADLGTYATANDGFLAALALGAGQYASNMLTTYPTMTAAQAGAVQTEVTHGATITNPLHVADSTGNVGVNLDLLQPIASSGKLASIAFTDPGTPFLQLTAAKVGTDSAAIAAITGAYAIGVTGTAAQFSGETIAHLTTASSYLDVTDVNASAGAFTATFAENAAGTQGTLTVGDGVHSASVTLIGHLAANGFSGAASNAGFNIGGDGGGGAFVAWHA